MNLQSCSCRDCQNPLNVYPQALSGGRFVILAECKTPGCDLKDVTLSLEQLQQMDEETAESYRAMNRQNKAGV